MRVELAIALVLLVSPLGLFAKRAQPNPVTPIVENSVRYSAQGSGQKQFVVATEISTGKELWRVEIFHIHYKPGLERDVQDVYIKELKRARGGRLIKDERSRCYFLDLSTRKVRKRLSCF
jgi:hypothetical protein